MDDFAVIVQSSVPVHSVQVVTHAFAEEGGDDWDSASLLDDLLDYSEISEIDEAVVGSLMGQNQDAEYVLLGENVIKDIGDRRVFEVDAHLDDVILSVDKQRRVHAYHQIQLSAKFARLRLDLADDIIREILGRSERILVF